MIKSSSKSIFKRSKRAKSIAMGESSMIDQLTDAVFALDHNWRFTFFNTEAEKLLLRKKEDVLGKIVWDEFPEAFRTTFYYEYNKAMKEGIDVCFQEYFLPLRTWFDVRTYPSEDGLLVHFRDITNEKRELDISKQYYQSLFDHNPDAVFSIDLNGRYLSVNKGFENLFGYSLDEALRMDYNSLIAAEDSDRTIEHFKKAAQGEVQNYEITVISKHGKRIIISVTNVPIFVNSEIVGVYGIAKDITKRVQEHEELHNTKELHTLIAENSQDIIAITTPDGILTYITSAVRPLLGYKPEEVLHTHTTLYCHPDDSPTLLNTAKDTYVHKRRIRHKDGNYIWFEISSKIIHGKNGKDKNILSVIRDISEQIQAEKLMRRSERLLLAGQLAAGVAHEIRNPLTAVKGFLQILQGGQSLKKQYLDVMYAEITRIEDIIHELLLLAKPNSVKFTDKNIHTILEHVVTLMETEAIKENVRIETSFYHEQLMVNCDDGQIKQVFINLVKNSIEAMPKGGKVFIKTHQELGHVKITLTDTGYGISQEILSNIGQPFYTTKEKGTGLGLAVSFSIIDTHNGKMTIDSTPHKGTTFTITLPLAATGKLIPY